MVPHLGDPEGEHAGRSAHGRGGDQRAGQARGLPAHQGRDQEIRAGRSQAMAKRAAKSWLVIQWRTSTAWRWISEITALRSRRRPPARGRRTATPAPPRYRRPSRRAPHIFGPPPPGHGDADRRQRQQYVGDSGIWTIATATNEPAMKGAATHGRDFSSGSAVFAAVATTSPAAAAPRPSRARFTSGNPPKPL